MGFSHNGRLLPVPIAKPLIAILQVNNFPVDDLQLTWVWVTSKVDWFLYVKLCVLGGEWKDCLKVHLVCVYKLPDFFCRPGYIWLVVTKLQLFIVQLKQNLMWYVDVRYHRLQYVRWICWKYEKMGHFSCWKWFYAVRLRLAYLIAPLPLLILVVLVQIDSLKH